MYCSILYISMGVLDLKRVGVVNLQDVSVGSEKSWCGHSIWCGQLAGTAMCNTLLWECWL